MLGERMSEAMAFLRARLADGRMHFVRDVLADAALAGHSDTTIKRARERLEVKRGKSAGGWVCWLPPWSLPRPTVCVMVGGETGGEGRGHCPSRGRIEDVPGIFPCVLNDGHDGRHVFGMHRWGKRDHGPSCLAPTPTANPM